MNEYVILTDSACDMPPDVLRELDLQVIPIHFEIGGRLFRDDPFHPELDHHSFYELLRQGETARTAAINPADYTAALEPLLSAGKDVLILCLSTGLSSTYDASRLAVEELSARWPERKLFTVDTLSASLGQGLLAQYAARRRQSGDSIEAVRDWVEDNKQKLCHWFTVEDLMYLKRGGRVSGASAVVGTMLGIMPVLHVDHEGHLVPMRKVRGRTAAMRTLVDQMAATAFDPARQLVYISHGDCPEDAQRLANMLCDQLFVNRILIAPIGPTIGTHTGPGTLTLFFCGAER